MLSKHWPGGTNTDAAFQPSASVMTAWFSSADLMSVDQYVGKYAALSFWDMFSSIYVMTGSVSKTRPFNAATE